MNRLPPVCCTMPRRVSASARGKANGRVLPAVHSAVARGIHLDVGHGAGSFSFEVAEKALKQELLPGTISSDVHQFNVNGPVFDLVTTLSKFLHLGLTLEQVIERVTANPARTFGFPAGLGTMREGAEADIAVLSVAEGDFDFVFIDGWKTFDYLAYELFLLNRALSDGGCIMFAPAPR